MKMFFGLVILSGVLAVQVSGRYHQRQVPCGLPVNNSLGGPRLSCIPNMELSALKVLLRFLEKRNSDLYSVVCVTEQIGYGIKYKVQYDEFNWVEIDWLLHGETKVVDEGVLPITNTQQL